MARQYKEEDNKRVFPKSRGRTEMRADIVPGTPFPNYELPDHAGNLRRLSELQGGDPLCLVLARGAY